MFQCLLKVSVTFARLAQFLGGTEQQVLKGRNNFIPFRLYTLSAFLFSNPNETEKLPISKALFYFSPLKSRPQAVLINHLSFVAFHLTLPGLTLHLTLSFHDKGLISKINLNLTVHT